jgi:hypothetical protein
MKAQTISLWVLLTLLGAWTHGAEPVLVGRAAEMHEVLLPGAELRARKSQGLNEPLVLRIVATYPHGTAGYRYDLQYMPMVAGKHDLTQFLETADGQPAKGLPPLVIEATAALPPGPPGALIEPPELKVPWVGWYRLTLWCGGILWVGAGAWGVWFFRQQKIIAQRAAQAPALPLVDQVRARLEAAIAQPLGTQEKAELERLLLALGREKLGLAQATDPAVWMALRESPKTALWMRLLESWLYHPGSSPPSAEDLRDLLQRIH